MNSTNHNGYPEHSPQYPLPSSIARRIVGLGGYDMRPRVALIQAEREIGCIDFLERIGIGIESNDRARRVRARKIVQELGEKWGEW